MLSHETALKRLDREQRARQQAEQLLEDKSRELFKINQNLTELAQSLSAKSSKLEAILNHTLAGIVHVDGDGVVLEVNSAAETLFGADRGALAGASIYDLGCDNTRAFYADFLSTRNATHVREDLKGRRNNGETFPMEVAIASLGESDPGHTVWIIRDLSEKLEAEKQKQILQHEQSQTQKLESLGTLASGIAHEINTPVQYVTDNVKFLAEAIGDLELITEKYGALAKAAEALPELKNLVSDVRAAEEDVDLKFLLEEAPSAAEHALEGLAQIAKIVAAIKSFAHPGVEEKTLIDLNEAIATTSTVCRNQWKYVANLETSFAEDLPLVPCLPGELNQVILNLIVNAAHAIEDKGDGKSNRIRIATRKMDDFAEFRISDTGCGIPPGHAKKIFDPFFTTKEVGRGTGQGLSLCYSIITQKHGGSLTFESEVGVGTTFTVKLPLTDTAAKREAA